MVTTIEESKDIDSMRFDELIGFIQTYEITLPSSQKPKYYTFKASENEKKDIEISYNITRDELTHMTKRIKMVMKFNKSVTKIKNLEKKRHLMNKHPKNMTKVFAKVRKLNALTKEV